jgi:hypothetical protein
MLAGDRPIGLVATGDLIESLVRSALRQVWSGWVWVYGDPSARQRPFEEHEVLDGVEFGSYGDDKLALADDAWIASQTNGYYPGDHDGCQCICEPISTDIGAEDEAVA